jgi:hypothetical protein
MTAAVRRQKDLLTEKCGEEARRRFLASLLRIFHFSVLKSFCLTLCLPLNPRRTAFRHVADLI